MTDRRRRAKLNRPAWRSMRPPTTIAISPRGRWWLILAGIIALIVLMRNAPSILPIMLGGFTLAMILSFPVRALARVMPRGIAILVTFLALVGVVALSLFAVVPTLIAQLTELINATPALASESERLLRDLLQPLYERGFLPDEPSVLLTQLQQELINRAQTIAQRTLTILVSGVSQTINFVLTAFGVVFVAIYLLSDTRTLKAAYLWAVPRRYRRDATELWGDFGNSLSRYLSGLFVVILIQGVVSTLALTILSVPYPVVLGAWVSATAILPYIGAWLGAIPAIVIAAFISPTKAVLVLLAYVAIQQLEGNILTPRIQGQALRVHPILVFLAVITGSEIAGLGGAIFAVPTLAVLRVLFDFLRRRLRVVAPPDRTIVLAPAASPPGRGRGARFGRYQAKRDRHPGPRP